jgi:hypothetical protein
MVTGLRQRNKDIAAEFEKAKHILVLQGDLKEDKERLFEEQNKQL